jgi:hypothetical protein
LHKSKKYIQIKQKQKVVMKKNLNSYCRSWFKTMYDTKLFQKLVSYKNQDLKIIRAFILRARRNINAFSFYNNCPFAKHVHISCKWVSGIFMLTVSFSVSILLIDPSLFSAQLVQNRIFNTNEVNFLENSKHFSGVLNNSPLYSMNHYFDKDLDQNETLIVFAKMVKAAQIQPELVNDLYKDFLISLSSFDEVSRLNVLNIIAQKLQYAEMNNIVFKESFDIFIMIEKEEIWIHKFLLTLYQSEDREDLLYQTKIIFESLASQENWKNVLITKDLMGTLQLIKAMAQQPYEKDGETFYGSAELWMLENEVWQSL